MSKVYFSHTSKMLGVKMGVLPLATIAIQRIGDEFHYGVAICSKYDNFSRKYGREIAENRLNQGFGIIPVPSPLQDLPEKEACLTQLYNLVESVVLKGRKWKRRVTRFNEHEKVLGKIVEMKSMDRPNSTPGSNIA